MMFENWVYEAEVLRELSSRHSASADGTVHTPVFDFARHPLHTHIHK